MVVCLRDIMIVVNRFINRGRDFLIFRKNRGCELICWLICSFRFLFFRGETILKVSIR